MKHIAVARVWFEGNSFCPRPTTFADFLAREWHDARTAPDFYRGSRTEMGAVVEWMAQHDGDVQIHILRCAAAPPGGPLATGLFARVVDEIAAQLIAVQNEHRLDGVYLSLHGAMVAEDFSNADYFLVAKVRDLIAPDCPLALSFDLHANLDPALAELAQIIVGYKTYPHVDMDATATRALDLLLAAMDGRIRPLSVIQSAQLILPSHLMTTDSGPMADLERIATQLVSAENLLDITPFGGFAYADTVCTSASVSVCIDAAAHNHAAQHAGSIGAQMVAAFHSRRSAFIPVLPDAARGLDKATSLLAAGPGCVAVLDPADNPLSGGAGDTTHLFQTLLAARLDVPTVFAFFYDPALVSRARELGVGAELHAQLGARVSKDYGEAVSFAGRVELITDGQFVNDGPMEQGLACQIGPSVVLRSIDQPQLRVVVTSQCQSPNDLAWCRLHRIDLNEVRLFCVKAKNHFRAAFAPQLAAIIDIDAPGPAMLDLAALPYRLAQP